MVCAERYQKRDINNLFNFDLVYEHLEDHKASMHIETEVKLADLVAFFNFHFYRRILLFRSGDPNNNISYFITHTKIYPLTICCPVQSVACAHIDFGILKNVCAK